MSESCFYASSLVMKIFLYNWHKDQARGVSSDTEYASQQISHLRLQVRCPGSLELPADDESGPEGSLPGPAAVNAPADGHSQDC